MFLFSGKEVPSLVDLYIEIFLITERHTKPSQSASCLLAIPAFDHKAVLNNRHLNSNRGICLR